tara:strand:+ start:160 stop:861 length:702 start_codon:yes stop_codon:yes gene_type:complete
MQRNVYIEGEMGHLFGSKLSINAPTVKDVLKLLEINNPNFKKYLIDCHEKGVGFAIEVANEELEYEEELLLPLKEGDVTITPVPEGAGGGFKKILAALAIIAIVWASGGFGAIAGWTSGSVTFGVGTFAALVGMSVGMSLLMAGLSEMMAPDPSVDGDQEQSYLFNGSEQNIIEGDPVPILYGRLRIPGQPINFELSTMSTSGGETTPFQLGYRGDVTVQNAINASLASIRYL